jgi:hypothetical protein
MICNESGGIRKDEEVHRLATGWRFSAPIHTGSGTHPASCKWIPGVKRPGRGVNHPPPFRAEVKERAELYVCLLSAPSRPVLERNLPLIKERLVKDRADMP